MQCPHCHTSFQGAHRQCPVCGCKFGSSRFKLIFLLLSIGLGVFAWLAYTKHSTEKLEETIHVTQPVQASESIPEEAPNTTAAMIAPIEKQLTALQKGDLTGAYGLVSKQYREATSFEDFKKLVTAYPILTEHVQHDFQEHDGDDQQGMATLHLNPEQESVPLEYRLINEQGDWKIGMMRLVALEEPASDTEGMIALIRDQLALLEQGKIRQVYEEMLAKETQAGTPLDNFTNFIHTYKAFEQHTRVNFRTPIKEQEGGKVLAEIVNENGTTAVEYTLTHAGGIWKITGMHISSAPEESGIQSSIETTPSAYKVRDLLTAIEEFLNLLRSKETVKAYNLTSKEFQYANSQADFDSFFSKHREFGESSGAHFDREMFTNAIATFSGQLTLPNNKILPVEFDLVLEEGKWKILHIYALPVEETQKAQSAPPSSSSENALEFSQLILGTKVDDAGNILNPLTIFRPDSGDIYARLTIRNGTSGTEIQLLMRHVESGSALQPVTATLTNSGTEVLTFIFSPPPKGWPKGSYLLRASSTNVNKNFTFTVE